MNKPHLVTATELLETWQKPGRQVVAVSDERSWEAARIPGARFVTYEALNRSGGPVSGLLPAHDELRRSLAMSGTALDDPSSEVVVYDAEAGTKAGRLAFVLDVLGHENWAFLQGGLAAWAEAGGELASGPAELAPGSSEQSDAVSSPVAGDRVASDAAGLGDGDDPASPFVAHYEYILSRLGDADFLPVDTRSAAEFDGSDRRASRGGHIPGAAHFDWVEALDPQRPPHLMNTDSLRNILNKKGITEDKELVLYCQTHHRSSHTYAVLRAMGFARVRGYPGAWSDWGNRPDSPIEN